MWNMCFNLVLLFEVIGFLIESMFVCMLFKDFGIIYRIFKKLLRWYNLVIRMFINRKFKVLCL